MNILIHLNSDSELITYEACALAFLLASFDHQVQLCLSPAAIGVVQDSGSRLHGMVKSAPLYDLPPLWTDRDSLSLLSDDFQAVFAPTPAGELTSRFDSHLRF